MCPFSLHFNIFSLFCGTWVVYYLCILSNATSSKASRTQMYKCALLAAKHSPPSLSPPSLSLSLSLSPLSLSHNTHTHTHTHTHSFTYVHTHTHTHTHKQIQLQYTCMQYTHTHSLSLSLSLSHSLSHHFSDLNLALSNAIS